ncbi:MAG: hypothetical protein JSR80_07400 [Verrucomicrobia bacterium]|nr:hypothetical protein [Verrucomicrobiota bacterium]
MHSNQIAQDSTQLPPPPPPKGPSLPERMKAVCSEFFDMLQAEFRPKEACEWVIHTTMDLFENTNQLVRQALGWEIERGPLSSPPQESPDRPSIPTPIEAGSNLEYYFTLFQKIFSDLIRGEKTLLTEDEKEFVRLLSTWSAKKIINIKEHPPEKGWFASISSVHEKIIPKLFEVIEASKGTAKAMEKGQEIGAMLLKGWSLERRAEVLVDFFDDWSLLFQLVRAQEPLGRGEEKILDQLHQKQKLSKGILIQGDPKARRHQELKHLKGIYASALQKILTAEEQAERSLLQVLALVAEKALTEATVEGLDHALKPDQVDRLFFSLFAGLDFKRLKSQPELPSTNKRLQSKEREALFNLLQTWLQAACEQKVISVFISLLKSFVLDPLDKAVGLIVASDGRLNPKPFILPLQQMLGEVPSQLDEEEQEEIDINKFFDDPKNVASQPFNLGGGIVWTRNLMHHYPLAVRNIFLRMIEKILRVRG